MGLSLVTKTEYKQYLGLNSPTQDSLIDLIIPKVSELVKTFCRRTFIDYAIDAKIEFHEGGSTIIVPEEYPVLSIVSLEYSEDYGKTYTTLVEYDDYALSKFSNNIVSTWYDGFPVAINGYKLTYKAGFLVVPEDLKLAVLDLITYYIKNDMAIHSNKAPGTNDIQIQYVTTTNLPSHIKRVLDQYAANYS